MEKTADSQKIFYGWWLVLVCVLLLGVGMGASFYLYSVLAGAIGEEFGVSRAVLMGGATALILSMAILSPWVGNLLDRFPIKYTLMTGAIVMGLGYVLMAQSTNIWQVMACYALFVAAGLATLSPLAASTLLSRWFVGRRGLAIGIAMLGTQFGGFIFPPVVAGLIEAHDWRMAATSLGVFILITMPILIHFTVVDWPEKKGLDPNGQSVQRETADTGSASTAVTLSYRELCTQRNFLLLVFVIGVLSATNVMVVSNLALFATDMGEPRTRGAFLVSLVAILGIIASPLTGWLCDIFRVQRIALVVCAGFVAGLLFYMAAVDYTLLLAGAFFQGLAAGGILPLWAALVGRLFSVHVYGRVMGASSFIVFAASALSPLFAGWVHDATGSYYVILAVFLILAVFAALLSLLFRQETR